MEPGLYRDIPARDYHELPYFNNSGASQLERSPYHYQFGLDHPKAQTEQMLLGSMAHTLILEPNSYSDRYWIWDGGPKRSAAVKAAYAQAVSDNADRAETTSELQVKADLIAQSVSAHPNLAKFFEQTDHTELTGIYDHPDTGVRCKFRADLISLAYKTCLDIKTTADASSDAFCKSIFNYRYHRQAAIYLDGLCALGLDIQHFVIAAVETTAPYACAVYRLMDDAIDFGRRDAARLMRLYNTCQFNNDWPAYPEAVTNIGLPAWVWAREYA